MKLTPNVAEVVAKFVNSVVHNLTGNKRGLELDGAEHKTQTHIWNVLGLQGRMLLASNGSTVTAAVWLYQL